MAPSQKRVFLSVPSLEIKDIKIHQIRRSDTLSAIARNYNVPVRKILKVNPKLKPNRLRPWKKIAIPIPSVVTRRAETA